VVAVSSKFGEELAEIDEQIAKLQSARSSKRSPDVKK
jgi:hypothetical protein